MISENDVESLEVKEHILDHGRSGSIVMLQPFTNVIESLSNDKKNWLQTLDLILPDCLISKAIRKAFVILL